MTKHQPAAAADPLADVTGLLSGTYLGAKDVKDGDQTFGVHAAAMEDFEGKDGKKAERRLVLTLEGEPVKKLSLNDTNLATFINAWGKDARQWAGGVFDAFFDPTVRDPNGKKTGGLRVRVRKVAAIASAPAAVKPNGADVNAAATEPAGDIPF